MNWLKNKNKSFWGEFLVALAVLIGVTMKLMVPEVLAGTMSRSMIRYNRLSAGTATGALITVVPATVGTETKLKIIFGTGVTVAMTPTVSTTGLPAGVTALPGTLTAAGAGTSIVISGVTDLTVGTTYGVNIDTGISTPAAAGQIFDTIQTIDAGSSAIDTGKIASRFITNDQIVITANVPPSFNFVLSGNTDAFTADLDSSNVRSTGGQTVTVTTNAAKGWTGWVKSANAALSSVTSGESIGTTGSVGAPSTCQVGTDCYVLDADKTTTGTGAGALSIDAGYDGSGTTGGGTLSTSFQPFASRTGKTNGDVITLIARASIIATKAAANDYTDTLTVIGAGNF